MARVLSKNTTLCLLYQVLGATMMCWEWKGGDGTKKFEKHWSWSWLKNMDWME